MIQAFVEALQSWQPEWVWLLLLIAAFSSLLLMLRLFGAWGVTLYMCVVLIAANLHVLKAVKFSLMENPVALGTVLFATTFLSTDILNEYYGPKYARRAVLLGFTGFILFTGMMLLALGFQPLSESYADTDWSWAIDYHNHLTAIFTPIPSILLAGLIAYMVSQLLDIWVYQRIREKTQGRFRWLRNNASTWISAFVDNTIFSLLAWYILAANKLTMDVIWQTYIIGTYFLRIGVALLDTPILYLAKYCLPAEDKALKPNSPSS